MSRASVKFLKSAVKPEQYPRHSKAEIGIVGRSNAGKSSLINFLVRADIAKVSKKPGKTTLLNFFAIGSQFVLTDMPGYGFANRPKDDIDSWKEMVETYLMRRDNLRGLLLVMDCRRSWTMDEELIKSFCEIRGLPLAIILTKSDKLSRSQLLKKEAEIVKSSKSHWVFPISNLHQTGRPALERFLLKEWIK